jgi:integrase
MFVTSDGNPYARFKRALETGNEALVIAAARELPQVALDDALRICLVLRGGDRARYERAAVRWLGRFALEARNVTIHDLRHAADALDALPQRAAEAMERLQRLCLARGVG